MIGDFKLGDTLDFKFTTRQFSTGAPFTLAGTPVVSAYPDNSLTQVTAGITLTTDFDGVTGLNNVRVVATGANGYLTGTSYALVITTGTVDSVSVVGEVVAQFTLERGAAYQRLGAPAGASVSADILTIDNLVDDLESRLGTPSNLGTGATVAANLVDIEAQTDDIGVAGAGLTAQPWNAAWDAEVQSEVADALDVAIPGVPTADSINQRIRSMDLLTEAGGAGDLAAILTDTGTTLDGRIPAALVSGRIDASVGAMATGVVTATAIAADAIGASELAADAVAEIADAVWDEAKAGHTGVTTFGDLATDLDTVAVDVAGLDGAAMRGTDSAALASVCTEARLSELDAGTAGKAAAEVDLIKTDVAAILVDTGTTLDGRIPAALVGGRMDASVGAIAAGVDLTATMKASVNTEVDSALDTAIPGVPTADSINQRIRSMDLLTEAGGTGDLAAILTDTGTTLDGKLPAALVGGRMDSNMQAAATAVIAAGTFAAGAVDAAALAADAGNEIADAVKGRTLTEGYAADGAAPTLEQALIMLISRLFENAIAGTTLTAKKLNGTTTSMTFTLDDATNPTTLTRAT